MGPYLAAIPYTQSGQFTGPYIWSNQGATNTFAVPNGAPGCRVGATVAQFLMLGDLYKTQTQLLFTGDGSKVSYTGALSPPIQSSGLIYDQLGHLSAAFDNGVVAAGGYLSDGTVNNTTGDLSLTFGTAPPGSDPVYAQYTQTAPYRVWWSAIGDPTNWPIPLTNAALAAESGYQDLQPDLGPVMFIAGYPLYGLIFQRFGITRATYQGGNVVFAFATYEFTHGVIAHGAAVQVSNVVFFLADDGFFATDGSNVFPIGTSADNSQGIDHWLWENINQNALEAIRSGYDTEKRCVFFAIPTGTNTLPDTLLSFNPAAKRWTKSAIPTETIWTSDNGANGATATRQALGIIDQSHTPNQLAGSQLTGYVESCDAFWADGNRRLTSAVRPQISCTDNPFAMVGTRESLESPVIYGNASHPDPFTNLAPAMSSGIYTRVRLTSGAASDFRGASLYVEEEGPI